jgi:DNA-directed RNA polymerase specialized sigma24 family protein
VNTRVCACAAKRVCKVHTVPPVAALKAAQASAEVRARLTAEMSAQRKAEVDLVVLLAGTHRMSLRDTGKALGISYQQVSNIAQRWLALNA